MINRFEWLKAVLRSDLPDRAKSMAGALAIQFANDKTGHLNPSRASLCEALGGWKEDTARRAIGDLQKSGWLARTIGVGRGHGCHYVLLSPGALVLLRPAKVVNRLSSTHHKTQQICGQSTPAKPRKTATKTPQKCSPPYKDEQSFEQKKGARPAPHLNSLVVPGSWQALEWNKWLSDRGERISLRDLSALHVPGGYCLPWAKPPRESDTVQTSIARNVIAWAKDRGSADAA